MTHNIRLIQGNELKKLVSLLKHLNPEDPDIDEQTQLDVWAQFIHDPKIKCIVVEEGDQLIASCTLVMVPNLTRSARPYGLIENVITHPDFRKRGIGKQMLQYALRLAWEQNAYKVILLTSRNDEEVFRFYENAGFKRGIKTGFIAKPE
jgi:ribosomal protein S18 acetylase RimI-like enzyme